jgi:hypothetical protein
VSTSWSGVGPGHVVIINLVAFQREILGLCFLACRSVFVSIAQAAVEQAFFAACALMRLGATDPRSVRGSAST